MLKLKKESNGYYFENKENKVLCGRDDWEIVHIFKIKNDLWGWCLDKSMTKGTFKSLKEAREYFS